MQISFSKLLLKTDIFLSQCCSFLQSYKIQENQSKTVQVMAACVCMVFYFFANVFVPIHNHSTVWDVIVCLYLTPPCFVVLHNICSPNL